MPSRPSGDVYEETLAVFDRNEDRYEPLTTPEVATALDANRRTVYKRLRTLVERGELETKETGASSRVWWRPSAGSSSSHTAEQKSIQGDRRTEAPNSHSSSVRQYQPTRSETDFEREREPEQDGEWRRTLFEQAPDGIVVHDADGSILDANETFAEMIGYSREVLRSMDVTDVEVGIDEETLRNRWSPMSHGSTDRIEFEGTHRRADGSTYPADVWVARVSLEERERDRFVAFVRDVTVREEREHELRETTRQLRGILDTVEAAIFLKDTDGRYLQMNQNCRDILGVDADEEVVGMTDDDLFPEDIAVQYRADDRRVLEANETIEIEENVPTTDGIRTHLTRKSPIFDEDGDPYAVCAVSSDITERKERERELEHYETLARTASDVIVRIGANGVVQDANPAVAEVFGYEPDELVGESIPTLMPDRLADQHQTAVERYLRTDERRLDWDYVELPGVRADGTEIPLAISFSDYEHGGQRYFTGIIRDITQRKERERELERQREQLEALNRFNDVVHEITESVIDQSSRREIERAVCDRLAAFDSYKFAWICAVDSSSDSVEPRAEAGVEGYLEEIPLSIDPDDPTGQGPTGTAATTGEIQVTQKVLEDPEFEPWHEYARKYGFRSAASIPIVHEDTLYGVIGLTSERPDAFGERERAVVARLGEVVGHAIDAVERKRALLNDDVVELAFRMHDVEDLDIPGPDGDRVVFDRILHLGDESYLQYGTATGDAMETVRALVDTDHTPHAGPVTVVETSGDETRFVLRLVDPAFLPAIVDAGGYVHEVRIEDGKYVIRVHLPPSTDVRHIVDVVTDAFPGTEMVSRQQARRTDQNPHQIARTVTDRLTERQQVALEAAYAMGFFEWPRESSGEDVADSLEISPATFHQHLRKSQKKLLDVILDGTDR